MPPSAAAADAPESLELEEPQLDPSSLAGMLEGDVRIRNRLRFRAKGQLMRWVKDANGADVVGQCSMATIALNVRPLTILARYWCPRAKQVARSPSVDMIRKEARLKAKSLSWTNHWYQKPSIQFYEYIKGVTLCLCPFLYIHVEKLHMPDMVQANMAKQHKEKSKTYYLSFLSFPCRSWISRQLAIFPLMPLYYSRMHGVWRSCSHMVAERQGWRKARVPSDVTLGFWNQQCLKLHYYFYGSVLGHVVFKVAVSGSLLECV